MRQKVLHRFLFISYCLAMLANWVVPVVVANEETPSAAPVTEQPVSQEQLPQEATPTPESTVVTPTVENTGSSVPSQTGDSVSLSGSEISTGNNTIQNTNTVSNSASSTDNENPLFDIPDIDPLELLDHSIDVSEDAAKGVFGELTEEIVLKGTGEILEGIVIIPTGAVLTMSGSEFTGSIHGPLLMNEDIVEEVTQIYTGFEPTLGVEIGNDKASVEIESSTGGDMDAFVQLPFTPDFPVEQGQEFPIYSSTDGEIRSFHGTGIVNISGDEQWIIFETNHFTYFVLGQNVGEFSINSNADYVSGLNVTLNMSIVGAIQMRFGNSSGERDTGLRLDYATGMSWTLTGIGGNTGFRTVYGSFKNALGEIAYVSDSIYYNSGADTYLEGTSTGSKIFGTGTIDNGYAITQDSGGNIYVVGEFARRVNFFGIFATGFTTTQDGFAAKATINGSGIWVNTLRGAGATDEVRDIDIDSGGNLVVGGSFSNTGNVFGAFASGFTTTRDLYIAKLTNTGTALWVKTGGGNAAQSDRVYKTIFDRDGNIYAAGFYTSGNNGPVLIANMLVRGSGGNDAFIVKLNSNGSGLWIRGGGGTSREQVFGLATDSVEDIIVGGFTESTNTATRLFTTTAFYSSGSSDIFVAKHTSTGAFKWQRKVSGVGIEICTDESAGKLAVDTGDNIYVIGCTQSGVVLFQSGGGIMSKTVGALTGTRDFFVAKLDSGGNLIKFVTGASINNEEAWVVSYRDGYLYLGGHFNGTGAGTGTITGTIFGYDLTGINNTSQLWAAKLDTDLNVISLIKGSNHSTGGSGFLEDFSIDQYGDIVAVGRFSGTGRTIFGETMTSSGGMDTFISRFDLTPPTAVVVYSPNTTTGGTVTATITGFSESVTIINNGGSNQYSFTVNGSSGWIIQDRFGNQSTITGTVTWIGALPGYSNSSGFTRKAGGNGNDEEGHGIVMDRSGFNYILGSFRTTANIFGFNLTTTSPQEDVFISKVSHTGQGIWSIAAGMTGTNDIDDIQLDNEGNIFVLGVFEDDLQTVFGQDLTWYGGDDIFLAKLTNSGEIQWSKSAGGVSADKAYELAIDSGNNIYVVGSFRNSNVNLFGFTHSTSGNLDIFVSKMSPSGNPIWTKKAGGTGDNEKATSVTLDSSGNIYVVGTYSAGNTIGIFGTTLTNSGGTDIFVSKLDTNGNGIWTKKIAGNGNEDNPKISMNGNSLYIAGDYDSTNLSISGQSVVNSGLKDVFAIKMDFDGNILDQVSYGGANNETVKMAKYANGNMYIGGQYAVMGSFFNLELTGTNNTQQFYLLSLTSGFDYVSALPGGDMETGTLEDFVLDSYSNIYSVGFFNQNPSTILGYTVPNSGNNEEDIFFSKAEMIPPTGTVEYNPGTSTPGVVTGTLTGLSESITILNNGGSNTYVFTGNRSFGRIIKDTNGNRATITGTVSRIEDVATGDVTIGTQTGFNFTGNVFGQNSVQNIEGQFTDYIWVYDLKGIDSGYYTTLSVTNLTGPTNLISSGNLAIKATGLTLMSGTTNPRVVLASGLNNYIPFTGVITFIKRDPAANSTVKGQYGALPWLRITIPAFQTIENYQGVMTYTLYEN